MWEVRFGRFGLGGSIIGYVGGLSWEFWFGRFDSRICGRFSLGCLVQQKDDDDQGMPIQR